MLRPSAFLLCIVLGLSFATTASAQWKWREKSGGKEAIKYSDLPPPSSVPDVDILQRPNAARRVEAPPPAASAASALMPAAPKGIDPDLEAARKKKEADQAAARKAEEDKIAAQRADNCQRAKSQLRTLDDGMRIARTNANGEREILNDQQRAAETQRTRDLISADCK
jgi:hypothetical protein